MSTDNITSMIEWVMLLEAEGSTNTLEALRKAIGITGVDVDGR